MKSKTSRLECGTRQERRPLAWWPWGSLMAVNQKRKRMKFTKEIRTSFILRSRNYSKMVNTLHARKSIIFIYMPSVNRWVRFGVVWAGKLAVVLSYAIAELV